jgi:rhodanese-related sulfurtransferase
MMSAPFNEISVTELAVKLAASDHSYQFVDVREPQELALASLPQFINLPLSENAQWSVDIHQRLAATTETIVLCHHGMRSAQMCGWLASQGFTNLHNVIGGIAAYAQLVDNSVPQY